MRLEGFGPPTHRLETGHRRLMIPITYQEKLKNLKHYFNDLALFCQLRVGCCLVFNTVLSLQPPQYAQRKNIGVRVTCIMIQLNGLLPKSISCFGKLSMSGKVT